MFPPLNTTGGGMAGSYRVRYKNGDLEVEVESEDKAYVERMVDKLRSGTLHAHQTTIPQAGKPISKTPPENPSPKRKPSKPGSLDVAAICKVISESEAYPSIQTNILKTTNQLNKVLLAFVAADECGYKNISTGDVARITAELGKPLSQSNASKVIAKHADLFSAGKERKQGAVIPYKINRHGRKVYSDVLSG
jgi:hypothetical protein